MGTLFRVERPGNSSASSLSFLYRVVLVSRATGRNPYIALCDEIVAASLIHSRGSVISLIDVRVLRTVIP